MRLLFVTDIHGSEICFKKFVNAAKFYEADVIILGGDTTGKMLVFLVDQGDKTFMTTYNTEVGELISDGSELVDFERQVRNAGYYPLRVSKTRMRELNEDPEEMGRAFTEVMLDTWRAWLEMAEERLRDSVVRCIVAPGNDDQEEIDEIIKASKRIEYGEGRVIQLGEYELLSCGWTNPTPWDTPRECSEEELGDRLEGLVGGVSNMKKAIFNLHAPPFNSGLDEAPELKEGLQLVASGATKPVGSRAVREFIRRHQPMLSLHGHIHEGRGQCKIGRTVCVNPGSAYGDGVLQGYLVDLNKGNVGSHLMVTG